MCHLCLFAAKRPIFLAKRPTFLAKHKAELLCGACAVALEPEGAGGAAHALALSRRPGHLQPSLQGIGTGTQRDASPRENRQALRDSWARSGARAGAGDCGTRAHGLYLAYFFQRARLSASGAEAYMLPHMS